MDSPERYARVIIAQLEGAVMLSSVYSDYKPLRECADVIISELNRIKKEKRDADKR